MSNRYRSGSIRLAIRVDRRSAGTSTRITILRIRRLVLEVQPRDQPCQHAAGENADGKMRCLQLAVRSGDTPRDDGLERKFPTGIRRNAPESVEGWIERPLLTIGRMTVFPGRVCLPDLDQRVRQNVSSAVAHRSLDDDVSSRRLRLRNDVPVRQHDAEIEERAERLEWSQAAHVTSPSAWHWIHAARYRMCIPAPTPAWSRCRSKLATSR